MLLLLNHPPRAFYLTSFHDHFTFLSRPSTGVFESLTFLEFVPFPQDSMRFPLYRPHQPLPLFCSRLLFRVFFLVRFSILPNMALVTLLRGPRFLQSIHAPPQFKCRVRSHHRFLIPLVGSVFFDGCGPGTCNLLPPPTNSLRPSLLLPKLFFAISFRLSP